MGRIGQGEPSCRSTCSSSTTAAPPPPPTTSRWNAGRRRRSTRTCSSWATSAVVWRREYVDAQALSPEGAFVRYDGPGKPPVTDGPFAETKDLIAGWYVIDVESWDRAVELAGELSAAPGAGGKPIHEWLEVRPFYGHEPCTGE
jgi:hypothetical protein